MASLDLALSLENIVRKQGSVPATIGLVDGRVKIGLEKEHFERLASRERNPAKISRRDIAAAMALKSDGGALAGIKVFATGGLGWAASIAAGRTETLGVPVLTYGASREFPAFFSRHSGVHAPWNVNDPVKAAKILHNQWRLGMNNGVMFAVPIPEEYEEIGATIQQAVNQAVSESEKNGVSRLGKEATPWLLSRVGELTQGTSRASNIALIENTALVANLMIVGSSAVDITAQAQGELIARSTALGKVSLSLGGVARNIAEASHRILSARSPQLSSLLISPIGDDAFGRLLVEVTTRIGMRVDGFIRNTERTAVCNMLLDGDGDLASGVADMDIAKALDANTVEVIRHIDRYKPRFVALDGNLSPKTITRVVGHCIKNAIEAILPAVVASLNNPRNQAPITFITPNTLELLHIFSRTESDGLTSHPTWWQTIDDLSLGAAFRQDLERLARLDASDEDPSGETLSFLVDQGIAQTAVKLLPFFQHLIIKCGEKGVLVVMRISNPATSAWVGMKSEISQRRIVAHGRSEESVVILQHFPPLPVEKVVNVTGAGDTFVGALLAHLIQDPQTFLIPDALENAISISQRAAVMTLQSSLAVSPFLSELYRP
ncbi:hypothetical protein DXG01_000252 [Tephrocybe rancida]|nr:hypothetical protein DXG01_000252 [Tephrocybe rancida]